MTKMTLGQLIDYIDNKLHEQDLRIEKLESRIKYIIEKWHI